MRTQLTYFSECFETFDLIARPKNNVRKLFSSSSMRQLIPMSTLRIGGAKYFHYLLRCDNEPRCPQKYRLNCVVTAFCGMQTITLIISVKWTRGLVHIIDHKFTGTHECTRLATLEHREHTPNAIDIFCSDLVVVYIEQQKKCRFIWVIQLLFWIAILTCLLSWTDLYDDDDAILQKLVIF